MRTHTNTYRQTYKRRKNLIRKRREKKTKKLVGCYGSGEPKAVGAILGAVDDRHWKKIGQNIERK